jgi:hypothetical protein
MPAREVPATASSTAANTSARPHGAGRGGADGDDQGGADVEASDLRLGEALGEVEREDSLEHAEGEDGEDAPWSPRRASAV